MEKSNQLLNEKVVLNLKCIRISSSNFLFLFLTTYLTISDFVYLVIFVNESWADILSPMYTIEQESLEQKINLLENDFISSREKEVIACLLTHVLLHLRYCFSIGELNYLM